MHTAAQHIVRSLRGGITACLLLVLMGAGTALAGNTGKIGGRVTDAGTKEPIVGVNILVEGTKLGASTDAQGEYVIPNVPIGTYALRATIIGYKPTVVTGVRVQIDVKTETNVALEQTVVELDREVVITAERPLVEKDNTSTRTILSSEEVVNRPTTELTGVIATLPSVNVEGGVMKVRGGTLDEVAFVIDGARARNPLDQSSYTNLNLSSVQEIEVITGSFNAEFGEARSGVVNIVTKEGGDRYHAFVDTRYIPPGKKHWGPALYDNGTDLYWENSHARHLQWWIDNPDQWVDPNNVRGSDPASVWTPEDAFNHYMATHQPLSDYTNVAGYQIEGSLGGPAPGVDGLSFFASGKYRSQAPTFGNAYLVRGTFFDGTAKLTYAIDPSSKLQLSGFYGIEKTAWGILQATEQPDYFYALNWGPIARYAYYDYAGLPESRTDGQTLKFSHLLNERAMYELKLSRVHAYRSKDAFPDDPRGWENASGAITENSLRTGTYLDNNPIGFNTLGYYDRHRDNNTDWTFTGYYSDQLNKHWQIKSGLELTYYDLDHYNQSKSLGIDSGRYHPYQGAVYAQNTIEFGDLIINAGLRFDLYNANDNVYDLSDPFGAAAANSRLFTQLSPRLGISHPIDDKTVLHFSYGHFFQRATFGDYGEGFSTGEQRGSLARLIGYDGNPVILGNRDFQPEKTVNFELGLERNFADVFVANVTAYYKDVTNTVRGGIVVRNEITNIMYRTNGNADYRDVKGVEISLRKAPSGFAWGYLNFTTQTAVNGTSGDAKLIRITPTGIIYERPDDTGDLIEHNRPRLKAGLYLKTPSDVGFLGGALRDILLSLEYEAVFPNSSILEDVFRYSDATVTISKTRPVDKNLNLRLNKEIHLLGDQLGLNAYLEVRNVFNDQWINFSAIQKASLADQRAFGVSDFSQLPSYDVNGVPILDMAKFRNLPRSILFGLSLDI